MKSIETQGKTAEQAIEIGLYKLGVTREQVNIEILEQAGLFNKARVRISLNTSSPEESVVKELIERPTFPAPKFWMNPEVKDFYEFTLDDFRIEDYEAGPQIKNIPIAV